EFGEHFPLGLPREIRARRGARYEEAGKSNGGRHVSGGPQCTANGRAVDPRKSTTLGGECETLLTTKSADGSANFHNPANLSPNRPDPGQPCLNPLTRMRSVEFHLTHRIALGAQCRDELVELGAVARLALDVGHETLGRQVGEDALVEDLEDVDVVRLELLHHLEQGAGAILQRNAQPREAARAREVA